MTDPTNEYLTGRVKELEGELARLRTLLRQIHIMTKEANEGVANNYRNKVEQIYYLSQPAVVGS